MSNAYKSFYLADLMAMIDRVAMYAMLTPTLEHKKPDGTVATLSELANYNSLVAINNEGIRDYVSQLKAALKKEAGGQNDDG
jgi:hypothetical protein